MLAITWLQKFIDRNGFPLKHKGETHIPHCWTKQLIFENYFTQMSETQSVSRASFYRLIDEEFPHIKILKVSIILFTSI